MAARDHRPSAPPDYRFTTLGTVQSVRQPSYCDDAHFLQHKETKRGQPLG